MMAHLIDGFSPEDKRTIYLACLHEFASGFERDNDAKSAIQNGIGLTVGFADPYENTMFRLSLSADALARLGPLIEGGTDD